MCPNNKDFSCCTRNVWKFWEVIGELRRGYSKLRDQSLRNHGFAWWRCGQKEVEGSGPPGWRGQLSANPVLWTRWNPMCTYDIGTSKLRIHVEFQHMHAVKTNIGWLLHLATLLSRPSKGKLHSQVDIISSLLNCFLKHYCNIMNTFTFIGILFIHSLVQLINSLVPACQSHGSRLIERLQEHFLQLHGSLQARCGKVLCMSEFWPQILFWCICQTALTVFGVWLLGQMLHSLFCALAKWLYSRTMSC